PAPLRLREPSALAAAALRLKARTDYFVYEQYEFFRQWAAVKRAVNRAGVRILGDMPIYVSDDSCDVWAHPELFQTDKNGGRRMVAGVPPDYFSPEGQLWGNPLYDWRAMKKTGYAWFIARIKHNLMLYDALRVDHFRALSAYWAVDAGASTAIGGVWKKGPGTALFDALKKDVPHAPIIAEDLGIIDDNVKKLLKKCGFPGMKVFQFGFDGDKNNHHLPHTYPRNTVAYSATHDNDTTLGWLCALPEGVRTRVLDYLNVPPGADWAAGAGRCLGTQAVGRALLASSADLAILPLQDLCGYGTDTRMNTPGTPAGNWRWRATDAAIATVDTAYWRRMNDLFGRSGTAGFPSELC
ncbi:MAG: 4-alpha-glucanotransferase, partial [Clostridiales bacterium]|nr:4-alpha-glucanotransferase [Clostridiales bacterium]